jgi:hypothetical protein|tara:strand:+ start:106 stop:576 length:471 start_codon:yes stop_codon:yes gene_type:complete
MFLITQPKDFNKNFLMISEKTKNNIMNDGYFYRLYYSDEYGTSKGLFLGFELQQVSIEKYFNKLKCGFNTTCNSNIIGFIKAVEKHILDIMPEKQGKCPTYRIEEQLQNGFIKIFYNNTQSTPTKYTSVKLLLKISGIWTDKKEYGVTFRFFFIRP